MSSSDQTTITPEQLAVLEPHLDRLKDAFYAVSEVCEEFGAAGKEHGLSLACALTFFRQLRDDARLTLDHANTRIGQIAFSVGATREELEARELHLAGNQAFLEKIEGDVDPVDIAIIRRRLTGG